MECSSRYAGESKSRACAIVISAQLVHPRSMTFDGSPCELTAATLAKALAPREISARDALEAHLARISARDARLSAFMTVDADGARRQADAYDAARGPTRPLHGVPIAVKDLTNTRGIANDIWIGAVPAPCPGARRTWGGEASTGRGGHYWQDQHAGIRLWRRVCKSPLWTDAQSLRSCADFRRLFGWLRRWPSQPEWPLSLTARILAAPCGRRQVSALSSRSARPLAEFRRPAVRSAGICSRHTGFWLAPLTISNSDPPPAFGPPSAIRFPPP